MPEVSVAVELRVAVEKELDPVALERAIAEQGRRGWRELYRAALATLDDLATASAGGARVRTEEGELVHSVFERGEAPPEDGLPPELVVVEADGTFLAAQQGEGDRFEVKTGVFYTGKDRTGGRRSPRPVPV